MQKTFSFLIYVLNLLKVHYARPTPIDSPTGRISFNCGLDCPAACIPMRTNRWWNTKTEEWVFSNDAIFQLIPTCDVGKYFTLTLFNFNDCIINSSL